MAAAELEALLPETSVDDSRISGAKKTELASDPAGEPVVVRTRYDNTTGVYRPVAPYCGFPAFVGPAALYVHNSRWVIGPTIGCSEAFHEASDRPRRPEDATWADVTLEPFPKQRGPSFEDTRFDCVDGIV